MENGWTEWKKHVLLELERLHVKSAEQNDVLLQIQIDIAKMKQFKQDRGTLYGFFLVVLPAVMGAAATLMATG